MAKALKQSDTGLALLAGHGEARWVVRTVGLGAAGHKTARTHVKHMSDGTNIGEYKKQYGNIISNKEI